MIKSAIQNNNSDEKGNKNNYVGSGIDNWDMEEEFEKFSHSHANFNKPKQFTVLSLIMIPISDRIPDFYQLEQ